MSRFKIDWPLPPVTIIVILTVLAGMVYASVVPINGDDESLEVDKLNALKEQYISSEGDSLSNVEPLQVNPADEMDSAQAVAEPSAAQDSAKTETPEIIGGKDYTYTVQSGDSFSGIASRFGYSSAELQALNQGVKSNNIAIGVTKIKVKIKAVHIVGPGDILSKIATKYQVSKEAIMRANGKKQDIALRGEEIIIPLN